MNAKEYLDSIFDLNTRINAKQREIDILNTLLYKLTRELRADRIQSSGDKDQLGSTVAKLIDARVEINKMIDEYADRMLEVIDVIDKVSDPKEYDLLHKHYVENMGWTDISREWDNSNQWVHEVKRNAYRSVQFILDEKAN